MNWQEVFDAVKPWIFLAWFMIIVAHVVLTIRSGK